jgi:hypothetical protein
MKYTFYDYLAKYFMFRGDQTPCHYVEISKLTYSALSHDLKTTAFNEKNSGALVRQRTIPTERPPLVGEISARKPKLTATVIRCADYATPSIL